MEKKFASLIEKKRWFTLDQCVELLSKDVPFVSKADLLQFYLQGDLVLSIIVNSQLAKQRWEYCSLPNISDEKCIYTRIAQRYLRDQLTTPVEELFSFNNIITNTQPNLTLTSRELFSELEASKYSYQSKLLKKAEEVFQRWKYRGRPQIRHEYGNLTNLGGIFSIRTHSKIESSFLDYILKGVSSEIEVDFIVLSSDSLDEYVLYADSQNPLIKTFSINDFVVQNKHLIEFSIFIKETGTSHNKRDKRNKQSEREKVLAEYVKEQRIESVTNKKQIEIWNELSAIDKSLFPRRTDPKDSLVKKFFSIQEVLDFERGRRREVGS